jgi:predicted HicB family RNase H-like nuclease
MLKNVLEYQGLTAKIGLDTHAQIFRGEVIGVRTSLHFEGRTYDELVRCFEQAVDDYLEFCQEQGITPEKTWKGKLTFRPRSDAMRHLIWSQACASNMSVNEWMNHVIEKAIVQSIG